MDLATIQNRIRMIEELEAENRTLKDLLKSELENSESYQSTLSKAKEAIAARRQAKERVMASEGCESTVCDIRENNEEINTLREILSTELTEYYEKNKTDKIVGHDGQERKFKIIVRLSPSFRDKN